MRAAEASAAEEPGPECRNCGAALPRPAPPFCAECGQETRVQAPTVREFLRQFGEHHLSSDGALWRSLRLLLLRPGELTNEYLRGRRRRYVLPLRLYLSISVVVLLGINTLLAWRTAELKPLQMDLATAQFVFVDLGVQRVGLDRGRFFCDGVPSALCARLERRVMADPAAAWRLALEAGERAAGKLGTAMFVLMPAFALLLLAAFAGQRWRYAEHLVFALHVHAFWMLAVGVAAPGVPVLAPLAALAVPVYAALAARRVYGGRFWTLALRLLAVTAAYLVLLALAVSALMLWALLQ
ncbi:MAG: DUF3667 domain-containing protein [Rubrivivax sp.]|nr:DUF3667 domain-containing protein [Rubrivivax sp.]